MLSQRGVDAEHAPIPSLLLTGTVHHHLVRERSRTRVGLVVESADAREVHHVALLLGYGASAVNPYLAMATVEDLAERGDIPGVDGPTAAKNLVKALGKGVRKTMSKMGVSTVASYTGAQIFEAVGLGSGSSTRPSAAPRRGSAASASTSSPRRSWPTTGVPTPPTTSVPRTGRCRSAASTSGAARASCTCSTRRPSSSCSTPPGPGATRSSRSTRRLSTTRRSG